MELPYFRCEDCGHDFEKTEFVPDIEDDTFVGCPACGGIDIQLVVEEPPEGSGRAA